MCYLGAMPRPNPLTPEILAAFLAELRRGTLVVAAAARVGMTVSTLYNRRRRDPAFDSEWTAAAAVSFGQWGWQKLPGGRWRRQWTGRPTARRLRFGGARRAAYLDALGRKGDCGRAARSARVDPRTVRSALRTDPGFVLENEAALQRGRAVRERRAELERARTAERYRRAVDRAVAALTAPANGYERHLARMKRGWRPDRPGVWRAAPPGRTPAEAIPELRRKIRRIELAGWKRSVAEAAARAGGFAGWAVRAGAASTFGPAAPIPPLPGGERDEGRKPAEPGRALSGR